MPLAPIRPRETRLQIDQVREYLTKNPFVLKVTNRTPTDFSMTMYKITNLDIEFANAFFYWNDTNVNTPTPVGVLMVPFAFNGEA